MQTHSPKTTDNACTQNKRQAHDFQDHLNFSTHVHELFSCSQNLYRSDEVQNARTAPEG